MKYGSIEEPKQKSENNYFNHYAYSLSYNENNEQANWVAYQLFVSELEPNYGRTNIFKQDSLVVTQTANNNDYKGSGYDRGHLAPAADMSWNEQAMNESFYYSNISPQLAGFNRGIWKRLEVEVREWARTYNSLYITTGPICYKSVETIGENEVAVPTHFYKTILIFNDSIKQGIGFVFPHEKLGGDIFDYAISIDSVEKVTGIDFYYSLPNRKEKIVEREVNYEYWVGASIK